MIALRPDFSVFGFEGVGDVLQNIRPRTMFFYLP
jgi:hypothetical protein